MPRFWVTWDHHHHLGLEADFPFWPIESFGEIKGHAAVIAYDRSAAEMTVIDAFKWVSGPGGGFPEVKADPRPDDWVPFDDLFQRKPWHVWPEEGLEPWADEPWAPTIRQYLDVWEKREAQLMAAVQAAVAPCNCAAPPGETKHAPECFAGETAKELGERLTRVLEADRMGKLGFDGDPTVLMDIITGGRA